MGLTIPATIDADRVSIRVNLTSGIPIAGVMSTTHTLAAVGDAQVKTITLADGRTVDNRDFILRYDLSGSTPQAGLLAHRDARGGTFSLLIEPPQTAVDADITPREMVFVLDTSGSMSGMPIEASKTFMRHALQALRPADYFRIIRFSNNASEFTSGPVPATRSNVRAGIAYVDSLTADGGTEVLAGTAPGLRCRPEPRHTARRRLPVGWLCRQRAGNPAAGVGERRQGSPLRLRHRLGRQPLPDRGDGPTRPRPVAHHRSDREEPRGGDPVRKSPQDSRSHRHPDRLGRRAACGM